ncbi:glycoside hydrolase family 127 protein [Sunxiuqinia sp. A32]|uniref:glycoside hydrolase family 127 protein n=1 Tax=Sunxiuqinia sp. A32 TaxID=3461496 RepID=UPI0040458334
MKNLTSVLLLFILFSITCFGQKEYVNQAVVNYFSLIPADHTVLEGYLGDKINLCIENRVKVQDAEYLIEPFRRREETRFWQTEFWGKWITSAIGAYQYNRDPEMLKIIQKAVAGLLATQTQEGYIGNYAHDAHLQQWDIWGRKYTLLGLLAYYDISGDKNVLMAATKLVDHLMTEVGPGKANVVKTGNYRGMPSSSVLEPVILLYKRTGEERFLDFAKYIVVQWETPDGPQLISKGLAGIDVSERFPVDTVWWGWDNGQKGYEMMSCYEGLLELYRITGEPLYLQAVEKTIQNIIETEINIAGSGSAYECWYHGVETQIYPSYHTMETCVTMTWMKLCNNLLQMTGNPIYADQIEKSVYNALLSSMMPDGSNFAKYSPLEGNRGLGEGQCGMHINCCIANAPRAMVLLPVFAVMKSAEGVAVNLYCQSESKVQLFGKNNVLIKQSTDYPVSGTIKIDISPEKESEFSVDLRIPAWSAQTQVKVNGESVGEITPGVYQTIRRVWKKGDQIELQLDMRCRVEKISHQYALVHGPVVLARDSRFNDGFVDETSVVKQENGYVELVPDSNHPEAMWMSFTAPLVLGTNMELDSGVKKVHFCDYASAGNTWTKESRYKVWLNESLDVIKEKTKQ